MFFSFRLYFSFIPTPFASFILRELVHAEFMFPPIVCGVGGMVTAADTVIASPA